MMAAFTTKGLDRLQQVMERHLDAGAVKGAVALVDRGGETEVVTVGEYRRDTIFRISSMTKPITAAAALGLVEECVLRLDDPVDELLPELADRQVLTSLDAPLDSTVPAERPITVRDLLTFTMGFGQLMADPADYPILAAAEPIGMREPDPAGLPEPDEWMRRLGELPLMSQPGERWAYHTAADVLGVLIARAVGKPLGEVLGERVLGPLGMGDTAFLVTELDRFVPGWTGDGDMYDPVDGAWSRPPAFPSGGGGLVSTADDMLAFGRALLAGGGPVLSRRSVAAMTTDQLTPAQKQVVAWPPLGETGWGLGVGVVTARTGPAVAPGRFGWDGGLGSSWYCDPTEDLVGCLMTQTSWTSPAGPAVAADFWTCAYTALT